MELDIRAEGVEIDAWLESYLRTTVGFAAWWWDRPRVEGVEVRIDLATDGKGEEYVRCGLLAKLSPWSSVSAGATGADVCQAAQEASDLLEVALSRQGTEVYAERLGRLAA
jgi:hypothetical protein